MNAIERHTYYFLRVGTKSVGGPYKDVEGLARALRRVRAKHPEAQPQALVVGVWRDLSVDETEALVASLEG